MSGRHARIRVAFENGSKKIAVFLALGAPARRKLLKNAIVGKPRSQNMDTNNNKKDKLFQECLRVLERLTIRSLRVSQIYDMILF
jgi:hypothetical protein